MKGGAPDRFDLSGSDDSETAGQAVLVWSGVAAFAVFLAVVALTYGVPERNPPEAEALLRSDPMPTGSLDPGPRVLDGAASVRELGSMREFGALQDVGPDPLPLDGRTEAVGGPAVDPGAVLGAAEQKEIAQLQVENAALRHTVDAMRNRLDILTERLQTMEDRFGEFTGSIDRQATRPVAPPAAPSVAAAPPAVAAPLDERPHTPFGIELGTYEDLATLKDGWRRLVADSPALFGNLSGLAGLRERNGETELLLIAGPFQSASQASDYCLKVEDSGRFCLPAFYVGQEIATR